MTSPLGWQKMATPVPPTSVTKEMQLYVGGLLKLFVNEEPVVLLVRPTDKGKLHYFVGDTSAEEVGSATQFPDLTV